jgi:hypothetical protein
MTEYLKIVFNVDEYELANSYNKKNNTKNAIQSATIPKNAPLDANRGYCCKIKNMIHRGTRMINTQAYGLNKSAVWSVVRKNIPMITKIIIGNT